MIITLMTSMKITAILVVVEAAVELVSSSGCMHATHERKTQRASIRYENNYC